MLGGFSMGSVMSYSLGLGADRPRPAGILAFSGFVPVVEGWEPDLAGRAGTRVFIAHGRNDPVMEVGFARRARDLLEGGGLAGRLPRVRRRPPHRPRARAGGDRLARHDARAAGPTPDERRLAGAALRGLAATKETLHRFAQIVGKVRMALVPPRNHWWHVTLYVLGARPDHRRRCRRRPWAEIELRLRRPPRPRPHERRPRREHRPARPPAVRALLHRPLRRALGRRRRRRDPRRARSTSATARRSRRPGHDRYDADAVERYWRVLRRTDRGARPLRVAASRQGEPGHLFWHSFDLAHARFSGRRAPAIPGADPVTAEAYSHEVIAFGWWPGDERRTPFPAFYSYTAPEPDGPARAPLEPADAAWTDTGTGSLAVLPYDAVRAADDPAAALLAFYESAYRAGATAAGWDVAALARP